MTQQSDWELICACRAGDKQAWSTLIDRYERLIYFVVRQQRAMGEDSADIVQMTLISMLENLHVFHPESNVKAWLCTVAKRHAWRHLNRHDREQPHSESDLADSPLLNGQCTEDEHHWEKAEWLNDGLNLLGGRCRELILALYLQDETVSYEAVAAQLNMRVGSIGPTRARCLDKLRKKLEAV